MPSTLRLQSGATLRIPIFDVVLVPGPTLERALYNSVRTVSGRGLLCTVVVRNGEILVDPYCPESRHPLSL